MEPERESFEATIKADRYDAATRRIYADWLEEHGYDDEAVVQRQWTKEKQQAEDWLTEFAKGLETSEGLEMSYEALLEAANDYIDRGYAYTLPFETPDWNHEEVEAFWKNFEIATGRSVSGEKKEWLFFRCAC
jgi:uncharacterized protein (TIGR02996 family)